jgi:hypothetical protein
MFEPFSNCSSRPPLPPARTRWRIPATITLSLLLANSAVDAFGRPPPGADPNSPEAIWYRTARTPECWGCCDVADGRPVLARPDATSSLGWAVLLDGTWTPVPRDTRATQCESHEDGIGWTPSGDYPVNPAGHAVVWIYLGRIRCFSPPGSGI